MKGGMIMKTISFFGKVSLVLLTLGVMGAFTPASAEASERAVVRTERRWVQPRYEVRYHNGYRENVIVSEGYWENVPVYGDTYTYYSEPVYSYPRYYYSYPTYYGGYGYRPGIAFD